MDVDCDVALQGPPNYRNFGILSLKVLLYAFVK